MYETDKGKKVVYGTELFEYLGSKRQHTDWIKERFADCNAEDNKDFQSFSQKNEKGGRPKTEYIIQLATAKEMAMLERNAKGKQVRRYFIMLEEKYKEIAKAGIPHNVKQLTINSREISKIIGKLHSWVLRGIRERIADLQEVGFDTSQMYIESNYVTKASNTASQKTHLLKMVWIMMGNKKIDWEKFKGVGTSHTHNKTTNRNKLDVLIWEIQSLTEKGIDRYGKFPIIL